MGIDTKTKRLLIKLLQAGCDTSAGVCIDAVRFSTPKSSCSKYAHTSLPASICRCRLSIPCDTYFNLLSMVEAFVRAGFKLGAFDYAPPGIELCLQHHRRKLHIHVVLLHEFSEANINTASASGVGTALGAAIAGATISQLAKSVLGIVDRVPALNVTITQDLLLLADYINGDEWLLRQEPTPQFCANMQRWLLLHEHLPIAPPCPLDGLVSLSQAEKE